METLLLWWKRKRTGQMTLLEMLWLLVNPWAVPSWPPETSKPEAKEADVLDVVTVGDFEPRQAYVLAPHPVKMVIDYDGQVERISAEIAKAGGDDAYLAYVKQGMLAARASLIRDCGC